ncbi:MAG: MobV family relaxase [Scytonema sp. PMC 1069.18]|nr:MobV family relaxase [Scytonema sp. PMC 1069.18]MEC4884807.1 MobV family relaxase [Scytonema sp. PMC 1070.18]
MVIYAICRIQKIKSWRQLNISARHNARERFTPNANPAIENVRLIGLEREDLEALFKERIGNQKIRSNAVLGVEMLLSASPEYFRPDNPTNGGTYIPQRVDDFAIACTEWLLESYGDRSVRADLHLDEITPHIHAYIVPLDHKGNLNCRSLFSGRQKLSQLQDSFARAVEHLGIERGVKGSRAKHIDIKQYYAAVNCNSLHLDLKEILPKPNDNQTAAEYWQQLQESLQPTFKSVNYQLGERQRLLKQKAELSKTVYSSEQERHKLQNRLQNIELTLDLWKAQANLVRDIPLEDVAYQLGLDPDDKGQHKWKGHGCAIAIIGSQFYDFIGNQHGGGGAIDLVMHVLKCSFKAAVVWLQDSMGESAMLKAVSHHARTSAKAIVSAEPTPSFVPPEPNEKKWLKVQQYLTEVRKLPLSLIETLHRENLVYADNKQNVVFIMRSLEGEINGAFLRGTYKKNNSFIGLAKGTKRSQGWFHLTTGGQQSDAIARVVLVKSPIEVLSIAVLEPPPPQKTLYLAADSARSLPLELLHRTPNVIAAYDNDAAGKETYLAIQSIIPHTTRLKPKAKDWNEQLIDFMLWQF